MTPTRYRIVASDPNAHLFEVCCTVAEPEPGLDLHAFFRDYVHGTSSCRCLRCCVNSGSSGTCGPRRTRRTEAVCRARTRRLGSGLGQPWQRAPTCASSISRPTARQRARASPRVTRSLRSTACERAPTNSIVLVRARNAGDVIEIHASRRDDLMRFAVELAAARSNPCWLTLAETAAQEVAARRAAWLGTSVAFG